MRGEHEATTRTQLHLRVVIKKQPATTIGHSRSDENIHVLRLANEGGHAGWAVSNLCLWSAA